MTAEKNEIVPTGGFMSIIEKAASLENIDVDKLERMMQMQLQWEDRQNRKMFDESKARISAKLAHVKVTKTRSVAYGIDKNDKSKGQREAFKYAALEDIDRLVRPILDEERMTVSYDTEPNALAGWHTIVCWLAHEGHREAYRMPMPLDTSGGKGNAQAMGSTQSYGMRRALCGALNIVTIGEDDDASGGAITDEQAKDIVDGLLETGLDEKKFLKNLKAETVQGIRTKDYARAMTAIDAKRYRIQQEELKKGNG